MKHLIAPLACTALLAMAGTAIGEIYQSKDAQGNPVFTDSPSAGAAKVDLPEENIADSVKTPAQRETGAGAESPAGGATSDVQGTVVVIPDSRNKQLQKEIAADRPHEVLEAEKRHEVGDDPDAAELQRRKEAKEGVYIDDDGNTVRVEHRGHAGGR